MGELTIPILLLAGAVILIFVEFFIPSGGLIGIMALLCGGTAVYKAFQISHTTGYVFAVVGFVSGSSGFYMGIKMLGRSPLAVTKEFTAEDGYTATRDFTNLIGFEGKTVSPLRPSGIAIVENKRLHVESEAGLIEPDTAIEVIEVQGNRILVRPKHN